MQKVVNGAKDLLKNLKTGDLFQNVDKRVVMSLALFGSATLLCKATRKAKTFLKHFVRPGKNLKQRYGGGWALVTGSTEGIGKGYAVELAKQGFNVVLMGRNEEKLQKVQAEISQLNKEIKVSYIVFDFNIWYDEKAYADLERKIEQIEDLSVLVNNVGIFEVSPFHTMKAQSICSHLKVNIIPMTFITQIALRKMLKRKNRGCILTVSSESAVNHEKYFTVYHATKAYNYSFSHCLSEEYGDQIDCLVTIPASVATAGNPGDLPFSITTQQHTRSVLSSLGFEVETKGHWKHDLYLWMWNTWPFCCRYRYLRGQTMEKYAKGSGMQ